MHHGNMMKRVIAKTGDPFAPIHVQDAHSKATALGKFLAQHGAVDTQVQAITDRLLKDFSDEEIDKLCETPSFVMALCGLLAQSITAYTRKLIHE